MAALSRPAPPRARPVAGGARRRTLATPPRAAGPAGGRGADNSARAATSLPPPPPAALVPPPPDADTPPDAFALLGLNRAASRDTITRTYERLVAGPPAEAGYSEVRDFLFFCSRARIFASRFHFFGRRGGRVGWNGVTCPISRRD
jgi:hypothetical protein